MIRIDMKKNSYFCRLKTSGVYGQGSTEFFIEGRGYK